jgi:DNA-binding MarR family transcriptional regulator
VSTAQPPGERGERTLQALAEAARALSDWQARRAGLGDLPPGSLAVLEPLVDAVALPAGELARRSGLAPSALSHALTRHERAGLVERERQRGDGRVVLVRLTRDGRRAVAPARALHARLVEAIESRLPGAELDLLSERLGQLAATLGGTVDARPRAGA